MCRYILYTTRYKDEILAKIKETELQEELEGRLEVKRIGAIWEIYYEIEESKEYCDEVVAHVISDVTQKQAIYKVCHKALKKREDLEPIDKEEITEAFVTENYLSRQEGFSSITYYLIYVPILVEVRKEASFNVDGWLQFRIQKYKVLLNDLLEQFIADFEMKKDVVNFIRLMRDVSMLSVPLEEILHLVYNNEGSPQLYNKDMKNVTGYYIKKYCKDLILDSTLHEEDWMLHILITVVPKKIVVHHKERAKQKKFLKTLEIIFDESIEYCKGCKYCRCEE
nr:sporulation protein YtxC [uncultured Cellulosilyticum sp.]